MTLTYHSMNYKAHLFICTASPEKPGKCGSKGASELRSELKAICAQKPYADQVRINISGCLDQCEHGIAAVIYPQGKWFTHQTKNSVEPLLQELEKCLKMETDK